MVESPKTGSDELGEAVRQARDRLGMSRRDLAESTGLSYPYISQIETGYRMPSTPAMRSLADALGLRPDSLFDAISPMTGSDAAAGRAAAPTPVLPGSVVPVPSASVSDVGTGGDASSFSTVGRASGRPSAAGGSPPPALAGSPAVPIGGTDGAGAAGGTDLAAGGTDLAAGGTSAHSSAVGAPMEASDHARTGSAPPGAPAPASASTPANPPPAPARVPANPSPAGAPTDLAAGAGGSWITNRSFRPVGARAAAPPSSTARHDRAIEHATDLLTSLPAEERLPALAEVQARVIRSIIDDAVGRDGVR